MTEYYYHLCPIQLAHGSIIKAGNWGRIVRSYQNTQGVNFWVLFREQTFEMVRQTMFPEKPSRFKCSFIFESSDNIEQFKAVTNRPFDVLHKVKIVDPSKPIHKCCMSLVELAQNELVIPKVEEQAKLYWEGSNVVAPEILTESDIEIIEAVTT